jgi:hypothetical protein
MTGYFVVNYGWNSVFVISFTWQGFATTNDEKSAQVLNISQDYLFSVVILNKAEIKVGY